MGKSNVGDVNYFSTVLKMNFDTGIVRSLGHRAKPLRFFTVHCWKIADLPEAEFLDLIVRKVLKRR